MVRLLSYLLQVIATPTGASEGELTGLDLAQVVVSLAIAAPMLLWSALQWRRSNLVLSALGDTGRW